MTNDPDPSMHDRARRAYLHTIEAVETNPAEHPDPAERPDPETLRKLEAAVASMPRLRREIFLAVRLDALTYAQIAEVTGLSVKQVERHMARAMQHLVSVMSDRPVARPWWQRWLGL